MGILFCVVERQKGVCPLTTVLAVLAAASLKPWYSPLMDERGFAVSAIIDSGRFDELSTSLKNAGASQITLVLADKYVA